MGRGSHLALFQSKACRCQTQKPSVRKGAGNFKMHAERTKAGARVELVICILAGGAGGVTVSHVWEELVAASDGRIGLALYTDNLLAPENEPRAPFWTKWWAKRITAQAAWGHSTQVVVQVELYTWALKIFPNAQRFYITSGDSIPLVPASHFLSKLQQPKSSIWWLGDAHGKCYHSLWTGLTRADTEAVCTKWWVTVEVLKSLDAVGAVAAGCISCRNGHWAEWALGTVIVLSGSICLDIAKQPGTGEDIMLQDLKVSKCPGCGKPGVLRAADTSPKRLKHILSCDLDNNLLFLRKVTLATYNKVVK